MIKGVRDKDERARKASSDWSAEISRIKESSRQLPTRN